MIKPVVLLILDGWGLCGDDEYNAIRTANKPNYDRILKDYPMVPLQTSGLAVGLPEGQMGNSEVGHLNIGSGRVVYQDLTRIDQEIRTGSFFRNKVLNAAISKAASTGKCLHLMGLLSDGGVHSHIDHLKALLELAKEKGVKTAYVHAMLDGRDVPPSSAGTYIEDLERFMSHLGLGTLATIQGRFYVMDRDKRWDRVEKGYRAIAEGEGLAFNTAMDAMEASYAKEQTDEFVLPSVIGGYGGVEDGDCVLFFNFRADRAREISRVFYDVDFKEFPVKRHEIDYVCLTEYDETLGAPIAYPPERLENTLGEYLAKKGMHQIRIAETEKYAHVTFFFNGGVEAPNPLEDRILVPSPKVATYDLQPEMSAFEVCGKVLEVLEEGSHEVLIVNFANCDMVGHTGKFDAAVKAVEAVDQCLGQIADKVAEKQGALLVTADHGNAECMYNKKIGETHTAHTTNPVPFIVLTPEAVRLRQDADLSLRDISPTILKLLDLEAPPEMTGKSIIE